MRCRRVWWQLNFTRVGAAVLSTWVITERERTRLPVDIASKLGFEDDSIRDLAETEVSDATLMPELVSVRGPMKWQHNAISQTQVEYGGTHSLQALASENALNSALSFLTSGNLIESGFCPTLLDVHDQDATSHSLLDDLLDITASRLCRAGFDRNVASCPTRIHNTIGSGI